MVERAGNQRALDDGRSNGGGEEHHGSMLQKPGEREGGGEGGRGEG